jgi:hypothetical protein
MTLRSTWGMLWDLRLKVFYIYIFYKPRIIGKHRDDIRGHWTGPQNYIFKVMKNIKRISWWLKI